MSHTRLLGDAYSWTTVHDGLPRCGERLVRESEAAQLRSVAGQCANRKRPSSARLRSDTHKALPRSSLATSGFMCVFLPPRCAGPLLSLHWPSTSLRWSAPLTALTFHLATLVRSSHCTSLSPQRGRCACFTFVR